jgi:hypothetical protein
MPRLRTRDGSQEIAFILAFVWHNQIISGKVVWSFKGDINWLIGALDTQKVIPARLWHRMIEAFWIECRSKNPIQIKTELRILASKMSGATNYGSILSIR